MNIGGKNFIAAVLFVFFVFWMMINYLPPVMAEVNLGNVFVSTLCRAMDIMMVMIAEKK